MVDIIVNKKRKGRFCMTHQKLSIQEKSKSYKDIKKCRLIAISCAARTPNPNIVEEIFLNALC
jgi:hypothetical protein